MTTREQIIQEIELLPDPLLNEILDFVRELKAQHQNDKSTAEGLSLIEPQQKAQGLVFQAFLDSLEERKEVYRRLASS